MSAREANSNIIFCVQAALVGMTGEGFERCRVSGNAESVTAPCSITSPAMRLQEVKGVVNNFQRVIVCSMYARTGRKD